MRRPFFGPDAWGPLARALEDWWAGDTGASLVVHTGEGEADFMPVDLFFRGSETLRDADREALALAGGRVLDAGSGVGSLALILQGLGLEVTAVEVIPEAVAIMKERGVLDARLGRLEDLKEEKAYDTVLLLMNGTALAGTLAGFPDLLDHLERLLAPGGQVLLDSTDLRDPRESRDAHGRRGSAGPTDEEASSGPPEWEQNGDEDYLGNLHYQLEYRGERGAPFPQLFLDPDTLRRVASRQGWRAEVEWRGPEGAYVARLTRSFREPS